MQNISQRILYATSVGALGAALLTSLAPLSASAQNPRTTRTAPAVDAREIDTLALRAHTRFLADDLLRGRGTGTEGEHVAAAYIESQLIALGVKPFSGADYRMPVPLRSATISSTSTLALYRGVDTLHFAYGAGAFIVNTGGARSFRDFNGDLFYAGPASSALQLLRRSEQLRGRVIAFNGALGAAAVDIIPLLIEKGAAGVIVLVNQPAQFDLYVRSRGESRLFADAAVNDPVWQPDIPVLIAGPAVVRELFRAAPQAASAIGLSSLIPLQISVSAHIASSLESVTAANVGGVIPGVDPLRRNDLLVYTAHYDHLGISTPDERGDSIYNGFSDNAAGCAMLLAIARAFHEHPPAYSVAFVFFTGEERGLLGSSYMAAFPPFPLASVKALINLDAGAPPVPPVSWRLAGGTEVPVLGTAAVDLATRAGWQTSVSAASPNSDYWPFLARGVPAVFIIPGNEWEKTTAAQRDALMKKWDHYHEAADEYHPDFPFPGVARYAAYALALGRTAMR